MQEPHPIPPTRFPAPVNDQWDYLLSIIWNQMVHLVITLDGHLDAPRLCRAMARVMEAEPLLGCRFVESTTPFWESLPSLPPDSFFSLVMCEETQATLQQVMTTRLDPAQGPQARLTLIRGPKDGMILSVNHAASDAGGIKHICRLLGLAYRALGHDPGFSLPRTFPQDRSFQPLISPLSPDARAAARGACGEQSAVWGIPCRPGPCQRPGYRFRVIEPALFLRMQAYTRSNGLTINDLLLAACFSAVCPEIPHSQGHRYPILTSVDLRRSHSMAETPAVANLSVAFEVWLTADTTMRFPGLVQELHRVMAGKKSLSAGIGAAIRLEEEFSRGFQQVRERLLEQEYRSHHECYPKNPFFSNTGIIPPECADFGNVPTVHAFIGPPVDYPPGFGIAASTFRNRLTLASGFCEDSLPCTLVERVLFRMEEFLFTVSKG